MKAARLSGPRRLELVEIDAPQPDGQDVLIRVSACGICGSDLHYWETGLDMSGAPGLILGHEFSGTVADPGSRTDLFPGDRVTALPLDPCGMCDSCGTGHPNLCMNGMKRAIPGNNSPGAYAEYLRIRPDMVRKLPEGISDIEAAMIEPASVALHAARQAGIRAGDRVLITGAGPIGLLCASWARICGASLVAVTEMNEARRSFAADAGDIDAVFDAADPRLVSTMKKTIRGSFDVAVETSASNGGVNAAIAALKPRGTLVLAGINFGLQQVMTLLLVIKEIDQRASMGYVPDEFDLALAYIAGKRIPVGRIVSRTIGLHEVQGAFERLASHASDDLKVMIRTS